MTFRNIVCDILKEVGKETEELILFFCKAEAGRSYVLASDKHLERQKVIRRELEKHFGQYVSEYDVELRVISNVYAYFDAASERVIEFIPMICDTAFTNMSSERLRQDFVKKLGILDKSSLTEVYKYFRHRETES